MSHESSNSHVPTHSGAAASSSTTTTRVGSCAASRARVKARATSSGEFRRRVRALKLVSIARADARRAIRLRTSMASADDAAATWERIVRLASAPDVCDLGQGWPDFGESVAATTAAARAMTGGDARANQYAPVRGRKELTEALMRYYERTGYSVGSEESIVVTCSGTEALYGAFQAAMRAAPEGAREFVFVEPFFPWYKAIADDVGATCVVIRAIAEDGFVVDVDAIRRACVSGRTCAIVSCSPHNPSGHVLSRKELEGIAAIAEEKDLFVISDEVYERSVFDPALEHVRLATIGDMRDRTVTIGSASKLLNLTGWRVGWAVGPPKMIDAIKSAHSLMSYAAPTPLQLGVAAALDEISADARSPRGRVVPDENAAVMADNARTLATRSKTPDSPSTTPRAATSSPATSPPPAHPTSTFASSSRPTPRWPPSRSPSSSSPPPTSPDPWSDSPCAKSPTPCANPLIAFVATSLASERVRETRRRDRRAMKLP